MKKLHVMAAGVLAATLLAACGGGDDYVAPGAQDPAGEVPSSAAASVDAYTRYGIAQVKATSETDEPLGVNLVTVAPTSETDEALSVN